MNLQDIVRNDRRKKQKLRAKFAGLAMQGYLAACEECFGGFPSVEVLAAACVAAADALIAELEKPTP